jgi:hypothetical protein
MSDKTLAPHSAKLMIFDGDFKPWNWYTAHDIAWIKSWDSDSFWHWRHHRNGIEYLFNGSKGMFYKGN